MAERSSKIIPIYAAAAILACSVFRFFQLVSLIDFNTGFFIKGSELAGKLIYVLLALAAAAFIVLCAVRRKSDAAFTVSADGMGERATQPLGISFLVGAVACLYELTVQSGGIFAQLTSIVPAILYAASGFVLLKNTVPPKFVGYIQMISAIFWFINTARLFASDLLIINHSDNLLLLITYLLTIVFFSSTARFYARTETKSCRMREMITGGLLMLSSVSWVISKALALLFGGSAVKGMSGMDPSAITAAAISTTFVFTLFFTEKHKEIEYIPTSDEREKERKEMKKRKKEANK